MHSLVEVPTVDNDVFRVHGLTVNLGYDEFPIGSPELLSVTDDGMVATLGPLLHEILTDILVPKGAVPRSVRHRSIAQLPA